jgi:hypothetical protein
MWARWRAKRKWQAALDAMFEGVTALTLRLRGKLGVPAIELRMEGAREILDARRALRTSGVVMYVLCGADIELELSAGARQVATLRLFGDDIVAWDGLTHQLAIENPERVCAWLRARGIPTEDERRAAFLNALWRQVPAPLQRFRDRNELCLQVTADVRAEVERAYPQGLERAEVLLQWFASATMRDSTTALCLELVSLEALLAFLEHASGDSSRRELGLRLLTDHAFVERRGSDLARLPPELKVAVLAYHREHETLDGRRLREALASTASDTR